MTFRQTFLNETPDNSVFAMVDTRFSVALVTMMLSMTSFAIAEPPRREIQADSVTDIAAVSGRVGVLAAPKVLTVAIDDLTQCRVQKDAGVSGVIAMSDMGLEGPFLAVWWNTEGLLTATLRSAASVAEESFTLRDGRQTEVILVRRGAIIYAYADESGVEDPLIAVDFVFGTGLVAGALVEKDYSGQAPAMIPVVDAPTLTGDLRQNQPGTKLAGDWISEDDPGTLGGTHLLNRGDGADASIAVRIENLLPGTHELWIRHAAARSRTEVAEVTVEGFGMPVSLVVNQQISGGVWLPLGRFVSESVTSTSIRLAPGQVGSGSLSLDAVHTVWALWKDENQDQLPDELEGAEAFVSHERSGVYEAKKNGSAVDGNLPNSVSSSLTAVDRLPESDGSKSVIYVHSALGNDTFDGRSDKAQAGAWFSVKRGPKRSIEAALKSVSKTTRVVELHLDGKLEPLPGGFQDLGNFNLVLVPGKNGASLESLDPPPSLPAPSFFPLPSSR
jgi:hypothetical protein